MNKLDLSQVGYDELVMEVRNRGKEENEIALISTRNLVRELDGRFHHIVVVGTANKAADITEFYTHYKGSNQEIGLSIAMLNRAIIKERGVGLQEDEPE